MHLASRRAVADRQLRHASAAMQWPQAERSKMQTTPTERCAAKAKPARRARPGAPEHSRAERQAIAPQRAQSLPASSRTKPQEPVPSQAPQSKLTSRFASIHIKTRLDTAPLVSALLPG